MTKKDTDKPVVLSKIYTRGGDGGQTRLSDMSKAAKTDPRIAAYADAEEANAAIGVALALGEVPGDVRAVLARVQNELFDLGADLSTPLAPEGEEPEFPPLRVEQDYIDRLEADCDAFNAGLPVLRSFILPGGTPAVALMHQARVVSRRAERTAWAAIGEHGTDPGGGINVRTAKYLNRLSDLLFVLCRYLGADGGEVLWKPGGDR
ncbi:cob(I)yrinic acid a,c-diamide adenosyltransferase [Nocardiopsis sp. CNT-189]|uniref:cob(I)yrinic acid a,c-diamide adenosyltransferase n=1 Tax=Nocardiopsis oceanisediminis TaxID=2816862 RepID=UPI003B2B0A3F